MARFTQTTSTGGSSFSPLPNFLRYIEGRSQLPALNENFGWDNYGVWFGPTSNSAPNDESYPIFTNFTIPSETPIEISVDVEADASCSDLGLALYVDGTTPYWSFGPNQSAITAQFNCPNVELWGASSGGYGPGGSFPGPGTYRYVLAYNPLLESSQVTFSVYDNQNQVVAGMALDERLPQGPNYRIGFAADMDSGDDTAGRDRSYMSNLQIILNPGEGQTVYSDSLTGGYSGSNATVDLTVPVSILDSNSNPLITFEKTNTGTARILTNQDDLSLRSARDITLFAGNDGPGNVYIGWGDAQYTPDSPNRVATIGDISGIKSFEKIYVTNNDGTGNNVAIGDDVWIGDVNVSNFMSVQGQQDANLGGILFGSAQANKIYTDGSGLTLEANNGDMNFYMDGGMYIGDSNSNNQIVKMSDLNGVASRLASGAFHDETSFGPYTANSEQALSFQSTDWSTDVRITGVNNSQITIDRTGKYNIQFSSQLHVTNGGAVVYIWLKKNGVSVPWSNTRIDMNANSPYTVAAWNWFVNAQANDYYEIFWSSNTNTVKIEAVTGLTGTKPSVPSNILTVNQVG